MLKYAMSTRAGLRLSVEPAGGATKSWAYKSGKSVSTWQPMCFIRCSVGLGHTIAGNHVLS